MPPIYCIMCSFSLNDDVRDVLFGTAYLMLRSGLKKKKVRSESCEGIITERGSIALYGTSGIRFEAHLETEVGDLKVVYLVRPQDLGDLERDDSQGAWVSPEEILDPPDDLKERMRPNPIRRLAKKHLEN